MDNFPRPNEKSNQNNSAELPPHVDRFIGVDKEQKKEARRFLRERFARGEQKIAGYEIEKEPRDKEILSFAEKNVDKICQEHGRDTEKMNDKKIHVLRPGGTEAFTEGLSIGGAHAPTLGSVLIDRFESNIDFALVAFHEILHSKVHRALQVTKPDENNSNELTEYRSGFSITTRNGKVNYFEDLQEAITSHLEQQFLKSAEESELFTEEFDTQKVIQSRQEERKKLQHLIDEIWQQNQKQFESKSAVKDMFVKAHITGRLLPVARVVESTFGAGSFREIGEDTARSNM